MKLEKRIVVCLDFVIDSSEALMFSKNGKSILKINTKDIDDYTDGEVKLGLLSLIEGSDEVQISFSMDRSQTDRYEYIKSCADQHKRDNPTPEDYKEAAIREKSYKEKADKETEALKKYYEKNGLIKPISSEASSDPSSKPDSG